MDFYLAGEMATATGNVRCKCYVLRKSCCCCNWTWEPEARGGGTVHPAIPDLRRTYGSVYARFDAGFAFRFRWVRVRFSWDPYRISTDFRIRTGFRTQVEWESPAFGPLGATWGLSWPF